MRLYFSLICSKSQKLERYNPGLSKPIDMKMPIPDEVPGDLKLAHLSLLGGSTTREAAPGLHRGQKVCPTRVMF